MIDLNLVLRTTCQPLRMVNHGSSPANGTSAGVSWTSLHSRFSWLVCFSVSVLRENRVRVSVNIMRRKTLSRLPSTFTDGRRCLCDRKRSHPPSATRRMRLESANTSLESDKTGLESFYTDLESYDNDLEREVHTPWFRWTDGLVYLGVYLVLWGFRNHTE